MTDEMSKKRMTQIATVVECLPNAGHEPQIEAVRMFIELFNEVKRLKTEAVAKEEIIKKMRSQIIDLRNDLHNTIQAHKDKKGK